MAKGEKHKITKKGAVINTLLGIFLAAFLVVSYETAMGKIPEWIYSVTVSVVIIFVIIRLLLYLRKELPFGTTVLVAFGTLVSGVGGALFLWSQNNYDIFQKVKIALEGWILLVIISVIVLRIRRSGAENK